MNQVIIDRLTRMAASSDPVIAATAAELLQQYKYERFHQQLKNLGITTLKKPADFYGLSLILGGCETSMWVSNSYNISIHK
jgi:hypothetical protein